MLCTEGAALPIFRDSKGNHYGGLSVNSTIKNSGADLRQV